MVVRIALLAVAVLITSVWLLVAESEAACPVGTYPWTDQWGNRTCRSFDSGQDVTISPPTATPSGCPVGYYVWTDQWGNRICRSFTGAPPAYDTSKGCPVGTYPWRDTWGNPVCRQF